jgi:hypothetical protein
MLIPDVPARDMLNQTKPTEKAAELFGERRRWDLNPHAPKGRRVSCNSPTVYFPLFTSKRRKDLERGERPDCSTPAFLSYLNYSDN